jgi:hypothetical protein
MIPSVVSKITASAQIASPATTPPPEQIDTFGGTGSPQTSLSTTLPAGSTGLATPGSVSDPGQTGVGFYQFSAKSVSAWKNDRQGAAQSYHGAVMGFAARFAYCVEELNRMGHGPKMTMAQQARDYYDHLNESEEDVPSWASTIAVLSKHWIYADDFKNTLSGERDNKQLTLLLGPQRQITKREVDLSKVDETFKSAL